MEKLNITTPDEYLEFINKYLRDLTNIIIGEQIRNKIIITSYLYLYDKDTNDKKEKVLHNAFSFNKEDECNNNYDFVYDFNNKITVNNEDEFNQLVNKLFKKVAQMPAALPQLRCRCRFWHTHAIPGTS